MMAVAYAGIFKREWDDSSSVTISFIVNGGPLIEIDKKVDTKHEKEIEDTIKIFYGKILDSYTRTLLKEQSFKEVKND